MAAWMREIWCKAASAYVKRQLGSREIGGSGVFGEEVRVPYMSNKGGTPVKWTTVVLRVNCTEFSKVL